MYTQREVNDLRLAGNSPTQVGGSEHLTNKNINIVIRTSEALKTWETPEKKVNIR